MGAGVGLASGFFASGFLPSAFFFAAGFVAASLAGGGSVGSNFGAPGTASDRIALPSASPTR